MTAVLTWNVQGAVPPYGSKDRIHKQVTFLKVRAELPELLFLNEVTTAQRGFWRDLLAGVGYTEIVDTLDWAHELRESSVPPPRSLDTSTGT